MNPFMTRKQFLRLLAAGSAGAALAACAPPQPALPDTPRPLPPSSTPPPATPPASTPTPVPASPTPSATQAPSPTAAALSPTPAPFHYTPGVKSRVVQPHLAGVWQQDRLAPEGLGLLLDHGITRLTGLNDAREAWLALFKPGERVAIKVNTIDGSNYWTHPALVAALTGRLVAAGLRPEDLLVFDRDPRELSHAGYTLNRDGPGVRCDGTSARYSQSATVAGVQAGISDLLTAADALINVPLVKQHGITGFSFAMKNHYGTIDNPGSYHNGDQLVHGISELNACQPIRSKTRLIIGDALEACLFDWSSAERGDSLFFSFDPVAVDASGLEHYARRLENAGGSPDFSRQRAGAWIAQAAALGIGTNDPDQIDWIEETI